MCMNYYRKPSSKFSLAAVQNPNASVPSRSRSKNTFDGRGKKTPKWLFRAVFPSYDDNYKPFTSQCVRRTGPGGRGTDLRVT